MMNDAERTGTDRPYFEGSAIKPRAAYIPSPDNPHWSIWVALAVWFGSVLAIIVFPLLFLFPYLALRGVNLIDTQAATEFLQADKNALLLQILAIVPAHIATMVLAWVVVTRLRKYDFTRVLGWRAGGMLWWHHLAIVGGFFALAVIVGSIFPEQENDMLRILRSSRAAVFATALMATLTAPLVEEVIYRGILYPAFERAAGTAFAVGIVTFLFAVIHVPQYYPSWSTIFLLTLLSLTLTLVRMRTGNLLPCIILHTIFNGVQSVLLILEPYLPKQPVPDPAPALFQLLIR